MRSLVEIFSTTPGRGVNNYGAKVYSRLDRAISKGENGEEVVTGAWSRQECDTSVWTEQVLFKDS